MLGVLDRLSEQCNRVVRTAFIHEDKLKVWLIEKKQLTQKKINYFELKKQLQSELGLPDDQCLQIIGDSSPFSLKADRYAVTFLQNIIKQHQGPILYGFTSHKQGGANAVVGKCLSNDPQQVSKVVANLVYPISLKAIKEWGCTYSDLVRNYLVVFDQAQECHFGDDIVLSDNLAKKLLCFEGGVISFFQVVNTLIYHSNPDISLVYGLREGQPWFSAAKFFAKLKKANTIEDLILCKNNYLSELKFNNLCAKPLSAEEVAAKKQQVDEVFNKLTNTEHILKKIKKIHVNHYTIFKANKIEAESSQSNITLKFY